MRLLPFLLAFAAGALVTLQIGTTAKLKDAFGETLPAIIVSSIVGVVILGGAMLVMQSSWPPLGKLVAAPPSAWLGGVFGAFYAIVTVVLARHLGAAALIALLVAGQLICSVIVDHFGIFGFEARAATLSRLAGCGLLLSGFFLIWRV
jgi:transporter family-2 protein